ncbi:MAG: prenyltransferase/squalene oxidase repeat-containing protein [Planctomycetota bacterium]
MSPLPTIGEQRVIHPRGGRPGFTRSRTPDPEGGGVYQTPRGRRRLASLAAAVVLGSTVLVSASAQAASEAAVDRVVDRGLVWLAAQQNRLGNWTAQGRYPVAMTALSGMALLCEGSTPNQGPYADQLRNAVDYLIRQSRPNGLIGDPLRDDRYTYGHGFAMLFLSQVVGEEEDAERRAELMDVLTRAVEFTGKAQTNAGGWGYVSAKDGGGFDEGSTTVTQVQGLRGCRNAGVPTSKVVIDKAVDYIRGCTLADGGVQYSSKGGGGRPAITAAAIACLYSAGEYDDDFVPRMQEYCDRRLGGANQSNYGHWHYAHFYYAQVRYREGGEAWRDYRRDTFAKLLREATPVQTPSGEAVLWKQGYIGTVYTTALNLIILQLDNACLPIYQR